MLLERNENRHNFKLEMTKFFMDWDYKAGQIYPFDTEQISKLSNAVIDKIKEFTPKLQFSGYELVGPTLTFGFDWEGEGVAIDINISPVSEHQKNEFRALFRWR
jgi:hypothetical protein